MTDTTYGLSADDLERAAEAVGIAMCGTLTGYEDATPLERKSAEVYVRAALPVIGPKIREALVREMIADLHDPDGLIPLADQTGDVRWFELADFPRAEMESFLASYLPAAGEREEEGAR